MALNLTLSFSTITATLLTLSTVALASPLPGPNPGSRRPISPNVPALSVTPTVATPATNSSLPVVKLPTITGASISGTEHIIRIAGNGMSLTSVAIGLPSQMENFSGVTVSNQAGVNIPAQISRKNNAVNISFDSPVPAGSSLEVHFNNVQMRTKGGERLPYQVTVMQDGATGGDISIGTALINVPNRD